MSKLELGTRVIYRGQEMVVCESFKAYPDLEGEESIGYMLSDGGACFFDVDHDDIKDKVVAYHANI
jgi:hypothetical protein